MFPVSYSRYWLHNKRVLPIYLVLEITSACNSKCATCFNWRKTDYKAKKEFSLVELKKIFSTFKRLLWLSISGGEPFLRHDLPEVIRVAADETNPEFITIVTNSLLPLKIEKDVLRIMSFYKKNLIIILSIDGIGPLHDRIRGVRGNFEKVLETYEALRKIQAQHRNLHLGVNTVICNLNQDKIEEIYTYVKNNLVVESHTFEIMRGRGRDKKVRSPPISFYRQKKIWFQKGVAERTYYKTGFSSLLLKAAKLFYHDLAVDTLTKKKKPILCYAGRLSAVIDCEGNVYPCESYKQFGNLYEIEFDFKKIWFSKKADAIRQEIKNKKCYCVHSAFQFVNILFNPWLYPQLLKYLNKKI